MKLIFLSLFVFIFSISVKGEESNKYISVQGGLLLNNNEYIKEFENSGANLKSVGFNYSLGLYRKNKDWYIGFIYNVMSQRIYGLLDTNPERDGREKFELQVNNYLVGLGTRKILTEDKKSKTYLRLDLGISTSNIDDDSPSFIGNPFSEKVDSGFGTNIGFGIMTNSNIDISLFSSIRKNLREKNNFSEFEKMTINASLGFFF